MTYVENDLCREHGYDVLGENAAVTCSEVAQ